MRLLAACCFTIQMTMYMAIVVYAPALALEQVTMMMMMMMMMMTMMMMMVVMILEQVTGFPLDIAVVVIFVVCIFYSAIGGIKAVMWTDTFQAVCMFGSFLAIIIKGNFDAGGASTVFDINYQSGRVELFNFDPDPRQRSKRNENSVWCFQSCIKI